MDKLRASKHRSGIKARADGTLEGAIGLNVFEISDDGLGIKPGPPGFGSRALTIAGAAESVVGIFVVRGSQKSHWRSSYHFKFDFTAEQRGGASQGGERYVAHCGQQSDWLRSDRHPGRE